LLPSLFTLILLSFWLSPAGIRDCDHAGLLTRVLGSFFMKQALLEMVICLFSALCSLLFCYQ
jgi:hypothetical protein